MPNKRGPGRPRLDAEPLVPVTIRVPADVAETIRLFDARAEIRDVIVEHVRKTLTGTK